MRNLVIVIVTGLAMVIAFGTSAEPTFTSVPGYISRPVYTCPGNPGSWTSGIQSLDYDGAETFFVFAENQYIIKKKQGSSPEFLFDYGSSVFGSFVKINGDTVYFGESSNGTVKAVSTAGGSASDLFPLENNYDCAFNSQSRMFISANPGWLGNKIYVWWSGMTAPQLVADVGNNSGPISFDQNDNLYYGRSTAFPPGPEEIVYFTSTQVANAVATQTPLTSSDWTVFASGVDAPGGFAFDRNTPVRDLFSASSALGSLARVPAGGFELMGTGTYPNSPRFVGPGAFSAFWNEGGVLGLNCTDYDDSYDSTIFVVSRCPQNFILGSGDYGIPGQSDIAIFRPSNGLWAIRDLTRIYFGAEGDLPVSADYDGDATTDPAVFRPASGLWAVTGGSRFYYGAVDDIPLPRDYDGSGTADAAAFRPSSGLWAVKDITRVYYGAEGDFPVPGDYEGNGNLRMACFRPPIGLWRIRGLSSFYYGAAGDLPVPGDYEGQGTVRAAIYRPSNSLWAIKDVTRIYFGSPQNGDWPLPVDYQGDGTLDPTIFRPPTGLWAVRGVTRLYFGSGSDFPASR